MEKLFVYHGQVASSSSKGKETHDIILSDHRDYEKAPTRLEVRGALAWYLYDIHMTDAEERYLFSNFFFDRSLFLRRIEIPSSNELIPAKVITNADFLSEELVIFGPKDYIETDEPEPMSDEQQKAWADFREREWRRV